MSVASLGATIAALNANNIAYRQELSPHTGQLTIYTQSIAPTIAQPGGQVNLGTAANQISNYVYQQNVDGYCDSIAYIGGVYSDTYYPSIWIATTALSNGSLATLDTAGNPIDEPRTGSLIFTITPLIAGIIISAIMLAIVVTIAVVVIMTRQTYAYQDATTGQLVTTSSWTEFMTRQNAAYWFVCGKDGYGVGARSQYSSASQVPQSEIDRWKEHCDQAANLASNDIIGIVWAIAIGALAIGGIYIAAKIIPSLTKKEQ